MNELYRPNLNKELLKLTEHPIALSKLYDLDLLPEQLFSQEEMTVGLFAAYNRLEGFLLGLKVMELCGVNLAELRDTRMETETGDAR